ncbi:DUF3168 domain-containing protein [Pararhizobium mangrovi]|uniref:DUF3168 domain-containing protein n=1 Tax=Pararhizobium mangrovi TaxID=2590452 RepID=A0A506UHI0_9HYPH|nr:DUF3168 domain-containing protein [Pararhizobium mangrovi]TPW32758.1 DUF3168 domain-containing protein [Pararhizobium mangrovi]
MTSEEALQRAVVAALNGDPAVTALTGSNAIYDRVIHRAAFPYLVLAEMASEDWSTATDTGFEHRMKIEAWSRTNGKREAEAIAGAVRDALHDQPLALEVGHLVALRCERVRVERIDKERLVRAQLRFRALVETG